MRYLFVLSLLLSALPVYGKDPCKKITRVADNITGAVTLKSPDLMNITVIKQFRTTDTFFAVLIHFGDTNPHFESVGAKIVFEDGTELSDETVRVKCVQEASMIVGGNMSAASTNAGKYILQGFFRISDEHAALFMLKKIKRVDLHTAFRLISSREAEKVMGYIRCMK